MDNLTREQKEHALIEALNKADKTSQGFFLYHLSMYAPKPGKIRDQVMALDDEDFDLFYPDAMDNLRPAAPHQEKEGGDHGAG